MEKLARKLTNAIQYNNSELTELQLKTMKFGLECLFGELSKFSIYFILFFAFSLTKYYIIAFIFFCTLRLIAGGYHEDTYWRCFFTTLWILMGIIIIGSNLLLNILTKITLLIISTLLAWKYAPVDHPNKPIISIIRRKRLKYYSVISFIIMGIVGLTLPGKLSGTALTAIFFEAISLPAGELSKRRKGL